jgi:hypothetical protein
MKRKIANAVEVRIGFGDGYDNVKITKYAEEEISFENDQERKEKEQQLFDDLMVSLVSQIKEIPEKITRKAEEPIQGIEESIKKAIPRWLNEEEVPNIANANLAEANHEGTIDQQKDNRRKQEDKIEELQEILGDFESDSTDSTDSEISDDLEIIEVDETSTKTEKTSEKKESVAVTTVQEEEGDEDDGFGDLIFDDEDLFETEK